MNDISEIMWSDGENGYAARWRSEAGVPAPKKVLIADDTMNADTAYRLACGGTALLWQGDFQNARQLLLALARRIDNNPKKAKKAKKSKAAETKDAALAAAKLGEATAGETKGGASLAAPGAGMREVFHMHRLAQAQRARILGQILVPLNPDYTSPLRRAPDIAQACREAYGPPVTGDESGASVVSLRELLGLIGAHEWRKKGVPVAALGANIHAHYGVFSPVRGEYIDLVAKTPLPGALGVDSRAFDIGTGTGVLAAVLAKRGVKQVLASECDPRALACARDNIQRLNLTRQVTLCDVDLFPEGTAPLIVCNPPWVPARPSAPIEHAIYDPDGQMLRGFLAGLAAHLAPAGEGWLILSDLAEHLGLRTRADLLATIEAAGLRVVKRHDITPTHGKVQDAEDPLHAARVAEVTSLWRLTHR